MLSRAFRIVKKNHLIANYSGLGIIVSTARCFSKRSGILDDVRTCINLGIPKRVPIFAITGEFDVKIFDNTRFLERRGEFPIIRSLGS